MIKSRQINQNEMCLNSRDNFEILFRRYFDRLFAYAFKIVNDEDLAKDLVQEVFLKVWERRKLLKGHKIESLLFTMLRNQCISHLRHVRVVENRQLQIGKHLHMEELYRIDFVGNKPLVLIEKELQEEFDLLISKLPPKCKEVFQMSRVDGLSNSEIATKLDLHIKSVEKHISKALKFFYAHFD